MYPQTDNLTNIIQVIYPKVIPLENIPFEVSNDIFFAIYKLYYVVQIVNLGIHVGLIN